MVDKSDMIADLYKVEGHNDIYFCDEALLLSKDGIIKTLLKIGSWVARTMFVIGMLFANYERYYLPEGSYLPEYTTGTSLIAGSIVFLLFSWFIQKFGKTKDLLAKILCALGWIAVMIVTLSFILAVFDPSTYVDIFTVYNDAGNILHSLH